MARKGTRKNSAKRGEPVDTLKKRWLFQTAKARFSEVFRRARSEGPQWVVLGKDSVVIVAEEEFERLAAPSRQPKSLVQFFRESPLVGLTLDLGRDED